MTTEVEIGIIRSEVGFDFAKLGEVYAFGRSDFQGFNELHAFPQLFISKDKDGNEDGVVILEDTSDIEVLREEKIDDSRTLYYNPQGRLSEIEFWGISKNPVVDERIPLSPDELERVKSLLYAYRTDLEAGKPGKPGFYHFIPSPKDPVLQS